MHFLSLFHCVEHCLLLISLLVTCPIIGLMFVPQTIIFSSQQITTYRQVHNQQLQSLGQRTNPNGQAFTLKMRDQCLNMSRVYEWMIDSCLSKCSKSTLDCGMVQSANNPVLINKWKYMINNITYFALTQIKNQVILNQSTNSYTVQFNSSLLPLYGYYWDAVTSKYVSQMFIYTPRTNVNCSLFFDKLGVQLPIKFSNLYANYYESTQLVAFLLLSLVVLFGSFFLIRTVKISKTTGFFTQQNRGYTQSLRSQNILLFFINFGISVGLIVSFFKLQARSDAMISYLGQISRNCVASPYNNVFKIQYQRDSVSFIAITFQGILIFVYLLMTLVWVAIRIGQWRYRMIREDVTSSSYQLHPM